MPMKSRVDAICSMSPGRMSIPASVASWSRNATGYVPFRIGSRNHDVDPGMEAFAAASASRGSSVAG